MKDFLLDTPAGWMDLIVRAAKIAVIGFVLLQGKEWIDAGTLDTPATLTDAVLIAGGTAVLYTIQMLMSPPPARDERVIRE